jgi:DNA ligase (NAD+)
MIFVALIFAGVILVLIDAALLEPVSINGVIIERATLHNEHEVNRLGLRVGDKVILKRAGDVIPKILGLEDTSSTSDASSTGTGTGMGMAVPFRLPASCPECGSPTERLRAGEVAPETTATEGVNGDTGDIGDAVTVRCTGGAACPAQVIEQIR